MAIQLRIFSHAEIKTKIVELLGLDVYQKSGLTANMIREYLGRIYHIGSAYDDEIIACLKELERDGQIKRIAKRKLSSSDFYWDGEKPLKNTFVAWRLVQAKRQR